MQIRLNGRQHDLQAACSLQSLVESLGLANKRIAVEHNFEIVPRSAYLEVMVKADDQIEIVGFVGGG